MSKKLFTFLLSELKTVRLLCREKKCNAVFEMSVPDLFLKRPVACPFCQARWGDAQDNPLRDLAFALQKLDGMGGVLELEFVLPGE